MLYSLSKSFTSTAVGLAVGEGKLSVDDPVLKFFPEEAPAQPSENLKSMRVSDLLRMLAGHQAEPAVAGTGAWKTDSRFEVKLCLYETPFYVNLSFEFKGSELMFDSEYNVSVGATKLPQMVARAQ